MGKNVVLRYKHWLISKIDTNGDYSMDAYSRLMDVLFRTDFFYIPEDEKLKMDQNRAADGVYLRTIYDEETDNMVESALSDKKASVLEVLVALSIRIEQDIMGNGDDDFGHWFVEMLNNLGLMWFSNNKDWAESDILDILRVFMYRRYEDGGVGSLFPMKKPPIGFAKMEIWDQMQAYLIEKYD